MPPNAKADSAACSIALQASGQYTVLSALQAHVQSTQATCRPAHPHSCHAALQEADARAAELTSADEMVRSVCTGCCLVGPLLHAMKQAYSRIHIWVGQAMAILSRNGFSCILPH